MDDPDKCWEGSAKFDPDVWLRELEYNVERELRNRADALKDDLISDDDQVRTAAEAEIDQILAWLLPPLTKEQIDEANAVRQQRLEEILASEGYAASSVRMSGTGIRERGRPRTEGKTAIRALQLRLDTKKSWREIVLKINKSCKSRGCKWYCPTCQDVHRSTMEGRLGARRRQSETCPICKFRIRRAENKQKVCFKCADKMADLVGRLESFLKSRGMLRPEHYAENLGEK